MRSIPLAIPTVVLLFKMAFPSTGIGEHTVSASTLSIDPSQAMVVVVDVWEAPGKDLVSPATFALLEPWQDSFAQGIVDFANTARSRGALIVWASSDCGNNFNESLAPTTVFGLRDGRCDDGTLPSAEDLHPPFVGDSSGLGSGAYSPDKSSATSGTGRFAGKVKRAMKKEDWIAYGSRTSLRAEMYERGQWGRRTIVYVGWAIDQCVWGRSFGILHNCVAGTEMNCFVIGDRSHVAFPSAESPYKAVRECARGRALQAIEKLARPVAAADVIWK